MKGSRLSFPPALAAATAAVIAAAAAALFRLPLGLGGLRLLLPALDSLLRGGLLPARLPRRHARLARRLRLLPLLLLPHGTLLHLLLLMRTLLYGLPLGVATRFELLAHGGALLLLLRGDRLLLPARGISLRPFVVGYALGLRALLGGADGPFVRGPRGAIIASRRRGLPPFVALLNTFFAAQLLRRAPRFPVAARRVRF
ncbi:MAG TPA: hypothetical protein VE360_01740, partial [Pyrinomonadaceae bacterium]|nr:hypothetical protein [Pyrinomonadaceae bacterium]